MKQGWKIFDSLLSLLGNREEIFGRPKGVVQRRQGPWLAGSMSITKRKEITHSPKLCTGFECKRMGILQLN